MYERNRLTVAFLTVLVIAGSAVFTFVLTERRAAFLSAMNNRVSCRDI